MQSQTYPNGADESVHPHIRTFRARHGRMSAIRERALTDRLPLHDLSRLNFPIDLKNHSSSPKVVVDFGCGMGDHTLNLLRISRETHVLAMDVHTAGITNILISAESEGLENFSLYLGDGISILKDAITPETIAEFHVLFPDPWPKARQQKRRLIQVNFLEMVHRTLEPGGIFRFVTDDDGYAQSAGELFNSLPGWTPHFDDWQVPSTNYHRRALKLGHNINLFNFKKI